MKPEPEEQGRILLTIARESLAEALGLGASSPRGEPWLREPGATFVTLRQRESLRGCVGTVRAYRPLGEDVFANARAAAFHDTRFPPVTPRDYPALALEVSLLTPPEPLPFCTEEEACCLVRPGEDGLIFECQGHRSTFLPQVWEQLPDPRHFLAHLKHKAGLPSGYWSSEVRLWRYAVVKWVE
jgi:hypothetical protein